MSLTTASHSTAKSQALLTVIDQDKVKASKLISTAIEEIWIGYANAMGLVYPDKKAPESRKIITMRDFRQTIRDLDEDERLSALYFLTGYARDVLHPQVLYGTTHQVAVEDYVMVTLNAKFLTPRPELKAGHKTCVGQLYSQIYNNNKNKSCGNRFCQAPYLWQ